MVSTLHLHQRYVFSRIKTDFIVHQYRRQSEYPGMDCRAPLATTNKSGSDPNFLTPIFIDRIDGTVRVAHVVFNNLLPPTHLMREPVRIRAPWGALAAMFLATVG